MASQSRKLVLGFVVVAVLTLRVEGKLFSVNNFQIGNKRTISDIQFDGTMGKIQDCIDNLKDPGDECVIQPGSYHEKVTITNKYGSKESPIVIRGDPNALTKLDGTVPLRPAEWERMSNGAYKAFIHYDITQLFIDDEMITNARWPNSLWSDKTIFDSQFWAKSAKNSTRGLMIDGGKHKLADSGFNVTGAMAVLNVGSFCTFTRKVLNHGKGKDRFTYRDDFGDNLNFKPKNNQYFLESKLEFLDNPGEWFYEKKNGIGTLYVMTMDGKSPEGRNVRGKVQEVAFNITSSAYVVFKDLTFFATTLQARSSNQLEFRSINFSYPTYNRRMLGDTTPPHWTKIMSGQGSMKFINNTVYGTDGIALEYQGANDLVENNFFEYNDWSGANMNGAGGGGGTVLSQSIGDNFIRNTLRNNGASVGYRSGYKSHAQLNDISRTCWGMIQHDGSGIQVQVKRQTDVLLEQNWIYDSPKYGLRFDGAPPNIGRNGTMRRNVIRKTNGMMVKGDNHIVDHNLIFHKFTKGGDHDGQGSKCNLCVLWYVRENPVSINHNTSVEYNAADIANGGVHNKKLFSMSGELKDNIIGDVRTELMDPDNMDFRPRPESAYIQNNVGPYSFEETKRKYWIPGRQLYKASNPVPPDGSNTVKADKRDVLMWLNGFQATTHFVYLGTSSDNLKRQGVARNGDNVVKIRKELNGGVKYYWRVDAKLNAKVTHEGDLWSFTTIE